MSKKSIKMTMLRRRLFAYLREHGYPINRSNVTSNQLADMVASTLGEKRVTEKGSNYLLRVEHRINRRGRDLVAHTPKWADKKRIRSIYSECKRISAETGIVHHVDHVIPVQGWKVSGLHVPDNLSIITAEENFKKSNKMEEA